MIADVVGSEPALSKAADKKNEGARADVGLGISIILIYSRRQLYIYIFFLNTDITTLLDTLMLVPTIFYNNLTSLFIHKSIAH